MAEQLYRRYPVLPDKKFGFKPADSDYLASRADQFYKPDCDLTISALSLGKTFRGVSALESNYRTLL